MEMEFNSNLYCFYVILVAIHMTQVCVVKA